MSEIFKLISKNPQIISLAFVVINAIWIVLVYFNKKRHEKKLIEVKQSFDLDLERRKKLFEMKTAQYETYFRQIDSIHNKHQTDYQDILMPIINEFMTSYLDACNTKDDETATKATIKFSERISKITRDGFQEFSVFESETNSLRLTASDEVAKLLDEIKDIYEQMFNLSGKIMSDLLQITINKDLALAEKNQADLMKIGTIAKQKAAELREQMRNDLKYI